MPVDISVLSAVTNVDANVKKMVLAIPDYSVGDEVHNQFVNKLEGMTPGTHGSGTLFVKGKPFRQVFFPAWSASPYSAQIVPRTGLSDSWWKDFSIAVVCQSIDAVTSGVHKQMLHSKIDGDVNSYNATLRGKATPFYSYIFSQTFKDFSVPFNAMDHNTAKTQYMQVLKSSVNIHAVWYSEGMWKNPDWCLYHHYIKLMALGAAEAEINQLNDELKSAGLPIPPDIDKGAWVTYSDFLHDNPNVTHTDIDVEARPGITRTEYVYSGGPMPAQLTEAAGYDFTANSMPGSKYRSAGGSCFSKGTKILMHDLSVKTIEEIVPGDIIASRGGPREVAFVADLPNNSRPRYSINELPFEFTDTHPFISGDGKHNFLCIEPEVLTSYVPILSRFGVGVLNEGKRLLRSDGSDPLKTRPVPVEKISKHEVEPGDGTPIFDVIPVPDSTGTYEYYAGTEGNFFLVAAELPLAEKSPYAAYTLLEAFSVALPHLEETLYRLSKEKYIEVLELLRLMIPGVLNTSISDMAGGDLTSAAGSVKPISDYVADKMKDFVTDDNTYHSKSGTIYGMLCSALGDDLGNAIELGWRAFPANPGETLALSVFELQLNHNAHIEPGIDLTIQVGLATNGGKATEEIHVPAGSSRNDEDFTRFFDSTVYFQTRCPDAAARRRLSFDILSGDGAKKIYTAEMLVPEDEKGGLRRLSTRVYSDDGLPHGRLYCDVRFLSDDHISKEKRIYSTWNDQSKLNFAIQLGRNMGKELIILLDRALSTVDKSS